MSLAAISLTKTLIEMPSVTPNDGGCLSYIAKLLAEKEFQIEMINAADTQNLFASYGDPHKPLIVFLGHVDVVPSGPEEQWQFPPFQATEHEAYLYGRGAADMKSGVAAMVCAAINFIIQNPTPPFQLGLLFTSDEEGQALHGVRHVMEVFKSRHKKIDYCIVGEPSAQEQVGDTIKIGRRGSLSGQLTIIGKQGHIAYPELAQNPIHLVAPILTALTQLPLDKGNDYFQPTQLQFSNIHAGVGATNVIPGNLVADFNLRYSPEITVECIKILIEKVLLDAKISYEITWKHGSEPFLCKKGKLLDAVLRAINTVTQLKAKVSTHGGTSDGRFVAPTGAEVIEVGVCNKTIHQVNECVKIADITKLENIYFKILEELIASFGYHN